MIEMLKNAYIRRKAKLSALPTGRFNIRLAESTDDYLCAFNLVQVSYAALGIGELGSTLFRMTEQHVLPESFVLIAEESGQMVGTITVVCDSPAGLPLDKDFPEQMRSLRTSRARLAEICSFAVLKRGRHTGLATLLILAASRFAWSSGATHTVLGAHPKMVPVYGAIGAYQSFGEPQSHASLSAPVAGLVVSCVNQENHARRDLGTDRKSGRTLESLVFGPEPIPNTNLGEPSDRKRPPMTRATFRELFLQRTDHFDRISTRTRRYVREHRSDETLMPTLDTSQPSLGQGRWEDGRWEQSRSERSRSEQSGSTWLN